ncbi:STAS domain-containing protein [Thalassomonas actiniarum]|uniref:STAS domain-containing protein n=1 Tax=Thalassomonas actiniarum TaxID=485447 RepID=A0AAE9YRV4_9GAMM|nr:STAS domain-containing protein [Thalassomonas actiniarum]WDE00085.1 STAS domain-containing protein [Thalassomonas actiniarum]
MFEGDMTIYEAALLYQEISEKLTFDADIAVNLTQVGEIDTSGIQLILQLYFLAQGHNFTLSHIVHGDASAQAFELLQLDVDRFNQYL